MASYKLLIADAEEDFRQALASALHSSYFVRCCANGDDARQLLRQDCPDVLVLDLTLPQVDGLTLLEEAARDGLQPMVMVISNYISPYVLDSAQRLGIAYAMQKPVNFSAAVRRIQDLKGSLQPPARHQDPESAARALLDRLNIPGKYDGYDYLIPALILKMENPRQATTKELYPAVARQFGCSRSQVERSIRNAIERAWSDREPDIWAYYFPRLEKRPSNGDFLDRMARALQQELE